MWLLFLALFLYLQLLSAGAMSSDAVMMESEEICKATDAPVTTNQTSDSSTQVVNSLELGDAYKLAVGNRGRQLSGALAEHWFGKDSSRLSEDLKTLISQLSAARGIEQPLTEVSPRVSINSDELRASDSLTISGMQILQKRVSLERNESGLSVDGSIVSEIEGEGVADRLKRQVEHDRKLLNALYKELEEERSASAIAANQAMAMITRLQEEKATLHMEALQSLRMMEEQAEYDMEALQQANDLLAEKEKEIQDLEAELEFYRTKFPDESMLDETLGEGLMETRKSTVDHTEANSIKETSSVPIDSVNEKPNSCYKVEETDLSIGDMNKNNVKNSLLGFEDDRLHILKCLKKLEKQLYQLSNITTNSDLFNGECPGNQVDGVSVTGDLDCEAGSNINYRTECSDVSMKDDVSTLEGSPHNQVHASSQSAQFISKEKSDDESTWKNPPVLSKGTDIASLSCELSNLNKRLEALKADHNFLERTINSLRIGEEGLEFVQEIASRLQELRRIVIRDEAVA